MVENRQLIFDKFSEECKREGAPVQAQQVRCVVIVGRAYVVVLRIPLDVYPYTVYPLTKCSHLPPTEFVGKPSPELRFSGHTPRTRAFGSWRWTTR
jgi:hypothetical protein